MAEGYRDFLDVWEGLRAAADEYRALDDERVLVLANLSGRGKTSGLDLDRVTTKRQAALFHIRDGRVTRLVLHWDRDRALADLGLEEYAMSEESTTPDPEEAVRRSMEAMCSRVFDGAVPSFVLHAVFDVSAAESEVLEGREAIRQFMEAWRGPYDDFELELEEFRDLGNGVTFSVILERGRLPGSDPFLSVRGGHIAVWHDGLIERNTVYREEEIDEARAAAERLAGERG